MQSIYHLKQISVTSRFLNNSLNIVGDSSKPQHLMKVIQDTTVCHHVSQLQRLWTQILLVDYMQ